MASKMLVVWFLLDWERLALIHRDDRLDSIDFMVRYHDQAYLDFDICKKCSTLRDLFHVFSPHIFEKFETELDEKAVEIGSGLELAKQEQESDSNESSWNSRNNSHASYPHDPSGSYSSKLKCPALKSNRNYWNIHDKNIDYNVNL